MDPEVCSENTDYRENDGDDDDDNSRAYFDCGRGGDVFEPCFVDMSAAILEVLKHGNDEGNEQKEVRNSKNNLASVVELAILQQVKKICQPHLLSIGLVFQGWVGEDFLTNSGTQTPSSTVICLKMSEARFKPTETARMASIAYRLKFRRATLEMTDVAR